MRIALPFSEPGAGVAEGLARTGTAFDIVRRVVARSRAYSDIGKAIAACRP